MLKWFFYLIFISMYLWIYIYIWGPSLVIFWKRERETNSFVSKYLRVLFFRPLDMDRIELESQRGRRVRFVTKLDRDRSKPFSSSSSVRNMNDGYDDSDIGQRRRRTSRFCSAKYNFTAKKITWGWPNLQPRKHHLKFLVSHEQGRKSTWLVQGSANFNL